MRKIPTVFKRDPEDRKHVLPKVTPGCEWVLAGEGVATRKYDGTCCMFDGSTWWARREVRPGKREPEGFVSTEHDEATGKTVGWEPMSQSGFARWHGEAVANYVMDYGEGPAPGTYELCGPKINGNPEGLDDHRVIAHAWAERISVEPDQLNFAALRALIGLSLAVDGVEGIVWHHPDGRMAKLKARDFPAVDPSKCGPLASAEPETAEPSP